MSKAEADLPTFHHFPVPNRRHSLIIPEQVQKAKTIPTRLDDIFLACYPKSGTHLILKILTLILNNVDDKYINHCPQIFTNYHWPQRGAVSSKLYVTLLVGEKLCRVM